MYGIFKRDLCCSTDKVMRWSSRPLVCVILKQQVQVQIAPRILSNSFVEDQQHDPVRREAGVGKLVTGTHVLVTPVDMYSLVASVV